MQTTSEKFATESTLIRRKIWCLFNVNNSWDVYYSCNCELDGGVYAYDLFAYKLRVQQVLNEDHNAVSWIIIVGGEAVYTWNESAISNYLPH